MDQYFKCFRTCLIKIQRMRTDLGDTSKFVRPSVRPSGTDAAAAAATAAAGVLLMIDDCKKTKTSILPLHRIRRSKSRCRF